MHFNNDLLGFKSVLHFLSKDVNYQTH